MNYIFVGSTVFIKDITRLCQIRQLLQLQLSISLRIIYWHMRSNDDALPWMWHSQVSIDLEICLSKRRNFSRYFTNIKKALDKLKALIKMGTIK